MLKLWAHKWVLKPTNSAQYQCAQGGAMKPLLVRVDTDTIRSDLRSRSVSVHGPTWVLFSHPSIHPTSSNTLAPQGWVYYGPLLGTGGWPGIGLVWHQIINTPFTPNTRGILANISSHNTYKYCSRCIGGATKTCGTDGHTSILCTHAPRGARAAFLFGLWRNPRVDKERRK